MFPRIRTQRTVDFETLTFEPVGDGFRATEWMHAPGSLPPGIRVFAFGDIHGRSDLLQRHLDRLSADGPPGTCVFLGDIIDRGPDTAGVIDTILGGLPDGFDTVSLLGNHEMMMLDFLDNPADAASWLVNGGAAVLESYGIDPIGPKGALRDRLQDVLPAAHRAYLQSLRTHFAVGEYYFVHAGVNPETPLEDQLFHDKLWIRTPFSDIDADLEKVVVHGHTIYRRPVVHGRRIGIDTGACLADGALTCLSLEADRMRFHMLPT